MRNLVPHSTIGTIYFSVLTVVKQSLNHVRVCGCTAYVLSETPGQVSRGPKIANRELEVVYLEPLTHGVFKFLVTVETGIFRVM